MLTLSFEGGGMVTSGQDVPLKIVLEKGTKPAIYRLRHTGEILPAAGLKAARARLSGLYLSEDNIAQTDLVFYLNDPAKPLPGFLSSYLQMLLKGQHQTLLQCAAQATKLGQALDPAQAPAESARSKPAKPTPYTIAEARRGLGEADKILRKAISSIGGLEGGFDTMLGRSSSDVPEPAASSLPINPEIFEGEARDIVIKAGKACKTVAPNLKSATEKLQQMLDAPQTFTLDQYQSGYTQAVDAAHNTREILLDIIAELRIELATEKLPLVVWRVHY
ncbi:MAG: hypothetical protein GY792_33395, partial [Gammaproteobacteria bacterium]|nr:hypothetical protein [Gammaproteobacteria bacterium]